MWVVLDTEGILLIIYIYIFLYIYIYIFIYTYSGKWCNDDKCRDCSSHPLASSVAGEESLVLPVKAVSPSPCPRASNYAQLHVSIRELVKPGDIGGGGGRRVG